MQRIEDRERIAAYLSRNRAMHVYPLADLDDEMWPYTTWFGTEVDGELEALCLLFERLSPMVLYAVAPADHAPTAALLRWLLPRLPIRVEASVGPGLDRVLEESYRGDAGIEQVKMILADRDAWRGVDTSEVEPCRPHHHAELQSFYDERAYRSGEDVGRFFEAYMLEQGPYVAVRRNGEIACAGGVHVRSARYGVAAIGNVATAPTHRRSGLARAVTAALCGELEADFADVGLNVGVANEAAIRCYRGLGFVPVCRYLERRFVRNEGP